MSRVGRSWSSTPGESSGYSIIGTTGDVFGDKIRFSHLNHLDSAYIKRIGSLILTRKVYRLEQRLEEVLMPPKVRELIGELERAGFENRGGKGSHRNFVHPRVTRPITIAGHPLDDAKEYQVRAVRLAIEESRR